MYFRTRKDVPFGDFVDIFAYLWLIFKKSKRELRRHFQIKPAKFKTAI